MSKLSIYSILEYISHRNAGIFPAFARLYHPRNQDRVVARDTDLVIEGFPRSANSFAVTAFRLSQRKSYKIAHHLHHEGQIILGVKWGVPTLVTVRCARDACLSLAVYECSSVVIPLISRWIEFHKRLIPLKNDVVFARFESVVEDFGSVMSRVNQRFGTSFAPFCHSDENVRRVFAVAEKFTRSRYESEDARTRRVASPNVCRDGMKEGIERLFYSDQKTLDMLKRAEEIRSRIFES